MLNTSTIQFHKFEEAEKEGKRMKRQKRIKSMESKMERIGEIIFREDKKEQIRRMWGGKGSRRRGRTIF